MSSAPAVTVRDRGPGLATNEVQQLFQPFLRTRCLLQAPRHGQRARPEQHQGAGGGAGRRDPYDGAAHEDAAFTYTVPVNAHEQQPT